MHEPYGWTRSQPEWRDPPDGNPCHGVVVALVLMAVAFVVVVVAVTALLRWSAG
jgi:hypothetical protein